MKKAPERDPEQAPQAPTTIRLKERPMATATVPRTTQPSKPPKAFYAHLFDESGVLAKVNGELTFFADTGAITTVEPSMVNFLAVLGEVGLADTQRIMDVAVHGGYAAIACTREN
jgi:hypothetical protein